MELNLRGKLHLFAVVLAALKEKAKGKQSSFLNNEMR